MEQGAWEEEWEKTMGGTLKMVVEEMGRRITLDETWLNVHN